MASTGPSTKASADSTTTPPTPTDKEVTTASAAFNHFSQGKRHLLVGDFKSAVAAFKEATEALSGLYGEQAPECGDAYYHYGRALLELARKEAGVLGGDLDGGSSQESSAGEDEDEEEESEESQEEEEEGGKKGGEEEDGKKEGEEGKEEDKKENGKEEKKEEDGNNSEESKEDNVKLKEGDGDVTEEEEEVTTLQCAWEWLDVARVIFDKQEETPELAKKRAQIRLSLGEVCIESEDYEGAISEFKQCLEIQEKVLDKDDRCLAETHYQLGLAHCFSDNFDEAITHYKAATEVIQLKIKSLKARIEEKNSWTKERRDKEMAEKKDVFYTEEGEIEDLEQLLPDILLKITDMEEMKASATERLQEIAAKALLLGHGEAPGSSGSSSSAAVFSQAREEEGNSSKTSDAQPCPTSIVVKRKRSKDDDTTEEIKKQRLEGETKTDESTTHNSNATQPKPIAVKRKATTNGTDALPVKSTAKKPECSPSKADNPSSAPESQPPPQEVKS